MEEIVIIMKSYKQSFFAAFLTAMLIFTGLNLNSYFNETDLASVIPGINKAEPTSAASNPLVELNATLADIAETVNPSVVTIFSKKEIRQPYFDSPLSRFFGIPDPRYSPDGGQQFRSGMGSGVIVSHDGYILTNNHVVEQSDEILVRVKGSKKDIEAKVIGTDPKSDIAVLKIEGENYPALKLGDSDKVRVGELAIAIGSPLQENLAHTVTMGIISAKGRSNLNLAEYEDFIQTDAAINPGNSGGALVNIYGELIGINTAIASRSGGNQGIGFSIPVDMAKAIMESLINYGKVVRGYLGVYMQDINEQMAQALKLDKAEGVIVAQVVEDGPAARAGLKAEDVIVEMNGKTVENGTQLKNMISTTKPGSKITLTVIRKNKKQKITVVLDELDGVESISAATNSIEEEFGFRYRPLDNELRSQYSITSSLTQGVVITTIDPRSRAYRGGLREGDAVIAINGTSVKSVKDFESVLNSVAKGEALMFKIVRRSVSLYFAFEK